MRFFAQPPRCGTSSGFGSPAPQWSTTRNPADRSVRMANRNVIVGPSLSRWAAVGLGHFESVMASGCGGPRQTELVEAILSLINMP
jgi:hypothetical protein